MIGASWARTQGCRAQTKAFPPHNLGLHYRRRKRTPQAPLSGFGGGGRLGLRRGHHDPTCHLPCHCKKYSRAREGAQLANAKPDDLSPIPGSHMVERETLESCPLAAACMCPYTYTHVTHQYVPMHIQPHTNKLRCKTIAIIRHGRTWKEGRRGRTVRLLFQKDLGAERSLTPAAAGCSSAWNVSLVSSGIVRSRQLCQGIRPLGKMENGSQGQFLSGHTPGESDCETKVEVTSPHPPSHPVGNGSGTVNSNQDSGLAPEAQRY